MSVQLNIKSAEAREMAEGIAQATGVSLTEAVVAALRDRQHKICYDERRAKLMVIVRGSRGLWQPDLVEADYNDWLYDKDGLPQ